MFYLTRSRLKQSRGLSLDGRLTPGPSASSPRNSPYAPRRRRLQDGTIAPELTATEGNALAGDAPNLTRTQPCFYTCDGQRDVATWELVKVFDPQTKFDTCVSQPRDVAISRSGDLIVSDCGNKKIKVFGRDRGVLVTECCPPSSHRDAFLPGCVTALPCGKIAATDVGRKRIVIFAKNGRCMTSFGEGLVDPRGIATNSRGQLIVADGCANQVLMFPDFSNKAVRIKIPGMHTPFTQPTGVSVGPNDDFVVSDFSSNGAAGCVRLFSSHGVHVNDIDMESQLLKTELSTNHINSNTGINHVGVDFGVNGSIIYTHSALGAIYSIGNIHHGGICDIQRLVSSDNVNQPISLCVSPDSFLAITEKDSAKIKIFKC